MTRQERTFVAFLVATALLGLGIRHYKLIIISNRLKGYKAETGQYSLHSQLPNSVARSGQTTKANHLNTGTVEEIIQNKERIDINSAGFEELMRLPGVGTKLATRIIEYRESHGPFSQAEQIMKVKGIGPKKFEKMRDFVTVQPFSDTPTSEPASEMK